VTVPLEGHAQSAHTIEGVAIEGNRAVDAAAIRAQLVKQKGSLTNEEVSASVKALYLTGFFDQVSASIVDQPRGGKVLKLVVVEKPVVRKVFIRGNKEIKESDLAAVLQLTGRRFIDRGKLDAIARRATSYYQSQGFYDVTFASSVVPVSDGLVDVTFTVSEGERYRIRAVRFSGLKELDDSDLIEAMQTRRYRWYSSWITGTGRLNKDQLENDRNVLRQYLLDHGFLEGSVGDPVISKEDNGLVVTFDIEEGPIYQIGSVTARGDLIDGSEEKTLEGLELEIGETFSATKVREESFRVSDKFTDRGYAFANVVPNTELDRGEHKVNLTFDVSQGSLVQVNRIAVRGNQKTYDNVIRRELKVGEQEQYSSSKIRRSQELLQRLGYFEEVNISQEPAAEPNTVDLTVNVREASTGSFSAGAGYSSADGPIANARLSEDNIFGTGRRAVLNFDLGTERRNALASVTDPRFMDSYFSLGADIYKTEREFDDYDRTLLGGAFTVGYPFEQLFGEWFADINGSLRYEYNDVDIDNIDREDASDFVIASEGQSKVSSLIPKLVRNTIDNPVNPTKGSRQTLSFEYAGLGGDEDYYLAEAVNQFYYPLFKTDAGPWVFSWRFNLAYGEAKDDEQLPLFRRYFPGGINSVRGFKNRSLGPQDSRGNEFGGAKQVVNNLEVIFPLLSAAGLRGVVFFDLGEAFDDNEDIDFGELRQAYGAGIRWTSPLGPIRVEFGFPLDRESGESSMVTLFSFGAPI
jgi:outer membrane protein insertion porin family